MIGQMRKCNACGYRMTPDEPLSRDVSTEHGGLKRTLSTEWTDQQEAMRTLSAISNMVQHRTVAPGDTIIHKGDKNRDLFFLVGGLVEISSKTDGDDAVLNQIRPPYLLGDIGFLTGFPRTATAKAKTTVTLYILDYEKLIGLLKAFPAWLHPLLTAFSSSIKSLHFQNDKLKKKLSD